MVCVYVTKPTSLSHSQLCCGCRGRAGLRVHCGLQGAPQAGLDLAPPGQAGCADAGTSLQAAICAVSAFLLSVALQQSCTGRTSGAAPGLLRFHHPSQLPRAPGLGRDTRKRWEKMGSAGRCRHLPHRVRTWFRGH